MNERIRELARQCGAYNKDDEGEETKIAVLIGKEVEKFAVLIVKECIAVHEDDYGVDIIGNVLKKHFGVEE